jgi:ankyrin repeat protein
LVRFVKQSDNSKNSSLHLASLNGNLSIVNLLLEIGCDPNAKNDENMTPLDLSCRMGNFEISKSLINHSNITDQKNLNDDGQYLLHLAAMRGENEVIRLLLSKGAKIDMLNKDNMNCLDIAIDHKQRDVIKILLEDPQWYKLIRTSEQNTFDKNEENDDFNIIVSKSKGDNHEYSSYSTLGALYKKKLWDIIKLILDKCKINENDMNFSIIDVPSKSISKHPLMLIARSGQENLIKHDVTTLLLQLKWRLLPRFVFYLNLFLYFLYLFLFSWYVIELSSFENDESDFIEQSKHQNNMLLRNNSLKEANIFNNKFKASVVLYKSRGFKINRGKFKGDEIKEKTNSTDFLMVTIKFILRSFLKNQVVYFLKNYFPQMFFFFWNLNYNSILQILLFLMLPKAVAFKKIKI